MPSSYNTPDFVRPPLKGAFRLRSTGARGNFQRWAINRLYEHGFIIARRGPLANEQFSQAQLRILERVGTYTLTPPERIAALIDAVNYVSTRRLPGAMVECGVWRGGSMMAVALTLLSRDDLRDLYLFDTYEGLTAPTERDVDLAGKRQVDTWRPESPGAVADLADVKTAFNTTGYDPTRVYFVVGRVEDTLPEQAPDSISLLRLDTDWYKSTKHELETLYPRLVPGGVLIIDDYGHFQGAREAVDEYFGDCGPFLVRTDYTSRVAVKPQSSPPTR